MAATRVNDVTYLILDVIDEMRLLQPSSNLQLSKKNPDRFLKRGLEIVRQGWGQPSIFNADMVVEEMLRQGKSIEDARAGGTSGCVETGAFGNEAYILTGYFNEAQGARDHALQRLRSAHEETGRHPDRRSENLPLLRGAVRGLPQAACAT